MDADDDGFRGDLRKSLRRRGEGHGGNPSGAGTMRKSAKDVILPLPMRMLKEKFQVPSFRFQVSDNLKLGTCNLKHRLTLKPSLVFAPPISR
jgi:hypothetical protein